MLTILSLKYSLIEFSIVSKLLVFLKAPSKETVNILLSESVYRSARALKTGNNSVVESLISSKSKSG